jgi:hypothetical protein
VQCDEQRECGRIEVACAEHRTRSAASVAAQAVDGDQLRLQVLS